MRYLFVIAMMLCPGSLFGGDDMEELKLELTNIRERYARVLNENVILNQKLEKYNPTEKESDDVAPRKTIKGRPKSGVNHIRRLIGKALKEEGESSIAVAKKRSENEKGFIGSEFDLSGAMILSCSQSRDRISITAYAPVSVFDRIDPKTLGRYTKKERKISIPVKSEHGSGYTYQERIIGEDKIAPIPYIGIKMSVVNGDINVVKRLKPGASLDGIGIVESVVMSNRIDEESTAEKASVVLDYVILR